ncbi:imidazole glycerol phosphate synthase cyclase subunit, partial [Candidatus Pelagibacter sp.]|nr:imidazole glycerol phosphate synthase cyclase subunit [Candidatus Pelagibacter sp.]
MKRARIIPRLDIKGSNLVKGIHLEGLRVLGDPEKFAIKYYNDGADEIMYQDVVASLYERNSLLDQISKINKKIFIPLIVGGGIRNIEDIKKTLKAGADKIVINTAAVKNPKFITDAARIFGSSTIVVAIEMIKEKNGKYYVFTDNGRERTGKEAFAWALESEKRLAGELIFTFIDSEGTGAGLDLEFIKNISKKINIPIIVHGGISAIDDIINIFNNTQASAVAVASMLHYNLLLQNKENSPLNNQSGNHDFLISGKRYKNFGQHNLKDIKKKL